MSLPIIHKGESIREAAVHSSVRLPVSLHEYARSHKISLSKTLTMVLAAAKEEEDKRNSEDDEEVWDYSCSSCGKRWSARGDPHSSLVICPQCGSKSRIWVRKRGASE